MRLVGDLCSVHCSRKAITPIHRHEIYCIVSLSVFMFLLPSSCTKQERREMIWVTHSYIFILKTGYSFLKKNCRERCLIIRYLKHYRFSSTTLSRRYVISSEFATFLLLILSVYLVLTSRVTLAVSSFIVVTNGPLFIFFACIEIYLGNRSSRGCYITDITITLGPRYGISLNFSWIPFHILLIYRGLTADVPCKSLFSMFLIILYDSFKTNINRYVECFLLNIGLVSKVRSELPPEVVREIVNRLHTFKDFIAAAGVSRTWRSACLSISRRSQLPWLMLSETLSTDMRHFFSLCDNNRYQLRLSEVQGKRCWGSPHGWVVTLGPDYETHLLHLFKRVQIALPPLNTIRTLAATEEWFRLVHKFILLKDPSHELLFLVTAIFGPVNRLAFARVAFDRGGEGAVALNRRGQGQWAIVTNQDNLKFNDVACFNDQIYGLCDNGKLVCLELDAPLAAEVQVIAPQPSEEEVGMPQKLYLMKSSENLFAVFHYGFHIPSEMRHKTIYFLVYKFNFGALAWEEVTDLEDLAVFVGDGNSWCIPTSAIFCRSNCIYFTDDNWEWQRYPGVAYGGHDVGVFNMAQRVIQRLPFGKDNPRFYSRPIWVTPAMRLDELYIR